MSGCYLSLALLAVKNSLDQHPTVCKGRFSYRRTLRPRVLGDEGNPLLYERLIQSSETTRDEIECETRREDLRDIPQI